MTKKDLVQLVDRLRAFQSETEWFEFKVNKWDPEQIGKLISALSNSACIHGQEFGYLVFGVEDETHAVVGTSINPAAEKKGNELFESWVVRLLEPNIDVQIFSVDHSGKTVVVFKIDAARLTPVRFGGTAYVRVGSTTHPMSKFPEKERKIWKGDTPAVFESQLAVSGLDGDTVLQLINYPSYYELANKNLPGGSVKILGNLEEARLIQRDGDTYSITNLGALLFARQLADFPGLERKAIRLIYYEGKNRTKTKSEITGVKGYAAGFEGLVNFVTESLPQNEILESALRADVKMYPDIAIRELVANAIIHQDLTQSGTQPMIEVFADRIEITNNGLPLIDPLRFIDEAPRSRNESLASMMRLLGVCEERGSGIDKVVYSVEAYQLPAPEFLVKEKHTVAILYAPKPFAKMNRKERIRACYQHACLRYVTNEALTNASLRTRFKITDKNYATASRIISDTIEAGLIRSSDPNSTSKKHASYVPFWAPES